MRNLSYEELDRLSGYLEAQVTYLESLMNSAPEGSAEQTFWLMQLNRLCNTVTKVGTAKAKASTN